MWSHNCVDTDRILFSTNPTLKKLKGCVTCKKEKSNSIITSTIFYSQYTLQNISNVNLKKCLFLDLFAQGTKSKEKKGGDLVIVHVRGSVFSDVGP